MAFKYSSTTWYASQSELGLCLILSAASEVKYRGGDCQQCAPQHRDQELRSGDWQEPGSARESDGDPGEGAGGVHRGGERHAAVHRSAQVHPTPGTGTTAAKSTAESGSAAEVATGVFDRANWALAQFRRNCGELGSDGE